MGGHRTENPCYVFIFLYREDLLQTMCVFNELKSNQTDVMLYNIDIYNRIWFKTKKTFIPYYNSYRTVTNDSKTITTCLTTQTALEAPWVLAYGLHDVQLPRSSMACEKASDGEPLRHGPCFRKIQNRTLYKLTICVSVCVCTFKKMYV